MNHVHYSEYGENWIDLSNIPLKAWRGKLIYDWRNCTEWLTVEFKHNDLQDVMLIKYSYSNTRGMNFVELNYEGCTYVVNTYSFIEMKLNRFFNLIPISKPHMIKYFKNGFEDASKITYANQYKKPMCCPNCKTDRDMRVSDLSTYGFNCPMCSKHLSYPERFTQSLLKVLGFEYETQKTFDDNKWRFDFYIPHLELVVEVHGKQHFEDAWNTKEDVIKNDNLKRKFIKFELGLNYTAVDISQSTPEYAWTMLSQSSLGDHMDNVDYDEVVNICNESNYNDNFNDILNEYNQGVKGTELAEKYAMGNSTIYRILKRSGTMRRNGTTKVMCISTGETYNSLLDAEAITGVRTHNISANCRGVQKTAGINSKGEPLVWKYL